MKSILLIRLSTIFFIFSNFLFAQDINVTLSVDMNDVDTHPDGVYLAGGGFGQDGLAMDDSDGDDIWTVTASFPSSDVGTTKQYKFRNQPSFGSWDGFEDPAGLIAGGCNTGEYNDRYFVVPAADSTVGTVCYGSCIACDATLDQVNITFSVNMANVETSADGVYMAGGNFGGSPPGQLMDDADGDDVWTITLPATPGNEITYKFANGPIDGGWQGGWEVVPAACGVGEHLDRSYTVPSADASVPTVCFSSCVDCGAPQPINVTLSVDMTNEDTHPDGVYLAGGNFGQDGLLMDDADGDDIWTVTTTFPATDIGTTKQYKFRNQPSFGTWDGFEDQGGLIAGGCNTGQYNDRYFVVPATDSTIVTVCYGSCVACDATLPDVNVTFSVNMADVITSADGVYIAGGNFGGSPPGQLMDDSDGDDVWTITLPAAPGSEITWKFANGPIDGGWQGGWEVVPAACGVGDYLDRSYSVPANDSSIPTVCFSSCINCPMEIDALVINDFDIPAQAGNHSSGGEWHEYEESGSANNFSNLSQVPADEIIDNDSPAMLHYWSVVRDLSWGGYTGIFDIFETPLDLSDYNNLSFKFKNISAPSPYNDEVPDVEFRIILWDISDVSGEYSTRADVETWWAFFKPDAGESPIMNSSDEGWVELRIPLVDNGRSDDAGGYRDGFANPGVGWGVSIPGNDQFDIDQIGGIAIEVVSGGGFAVTEGEYLIDDIQAIYATDISGCTDATACNFNPDATLDDGSCYDCIDVNFSVDMTEEETHPDGVYFAGGNFGQEGLLMDDSDGDDIWHVTVSLPEDQAGQTKQYKFRNQPSFGTWDGFEDPTGLVAGGCNIGEYNDRFFVVPSADSTVATVCYGSCFACDVVTETVDVTFAVNMADVDTNPAGVYMAGGNFGGNPPGQLMDDSDGDDVWTITLAAAPGSEITWKFANGPIDANWGGDWENVPEECGVGNYSDRTFTVPEEDAAVDTVCFSSCVNCVADYPLDVVFNLDMNGVVGFDGTEAPYVFGSYNNWDNFQSQSMLSDVDGDGIYSSTVTGFMFNDSVTVLFGYGQTIEQVPAICGIADPELGMYVRELPLRDADGESVLNLEPIAFGGCPPVGPSVHLRVDVSSVVANWPDEVSLCVVGSFNNWGSPCFAPMTDEDGDNIYEAMISGLAPGTDYEFKFLANEGWGDPITESGAPLGSVCDFNPNDDFDNYGFTATETLVDLGVYGWNECNTLSNDVESTILPTEFSSKAYPNPFNPYVSIAYNLPNAEKVKVEIVNLLGQNVKTLVNGMQTSGSYVYKWNGKDANGMSLNSGMYFAIINRESGRNILKITYLK